MRRSTNRRPATKMCGWWRSRDSRCMGPVPRPIAIEVDWLLYGPKLAQVALTFGADFLDAVPATSDESMGRRRQTVEDVERNIRAAGFEPEEYRPARSAPSPSGGRSRTVLIYEPLTIAGSLAPFSSREPGSARRGLLSQYQTARRRSRRSIPSSLPFATTCRRSARRCCTSTESIVGLDPGNRVSARRLSHRPRRRDRIGWACRIGRDFFSSAGARDRAPWRSTSAHARRLR